MRGQEVIFRALVAASALLTAALAAVLFVPDGDSRAGEVARATFSPVAGTAELQARDGARSRVQARPVPAREWSEANARPGPGPTGRAELPAEEPVPAREVASRKRDLAPVAPKGRADVAALARAALARLAPPQPVAARREETAAEDMQSLSAGVLAGLGLELAEPEDPAPVYPEAALRPQRHPSSRALLDRAGWATDYVLIGLGRSPRKIVTPVDQARRWSTRYVVNNLRHSRAAPEARIERPARDAAPISLEQVIVDAIRAGRSADYLEALIEELAAAGQLAAPPALMAPDGRLDSAMVLNALVSASTLRQQPPAPPPSPGGRVRDTVEYTVRPGDSLASIAYRFYGSSSRYAEIFEANRAAMPTPDDIYTGQRLTIPAG